MAYNIKKDVSSESEIDPKNTVSVADSFLRRVGGELYPLVPTIALTQEQYDALEEKQDIVYAIIQN